MNTIRHNLQSLIKDGPGDTHPLAITAIGLALFFPILGFLIAFIARTQIAYSQGRYSGDRLALAAIIIAPLAQFSTLIFGAIWVLAMVVIPGNF
jgi:hypothetical protein